MSRKIWLANPSRFFIARDANHFLSQIPSNISHPLLTIRPGTTDPEIFKYQPKKIYPKHLSRNTTATHCSLQHLRYIANTKGISTVIPYSPTTDSHILERQAFVYGVPKNNIHHADIALEPSQHPINLPGLILHPGSPLSLHRFLGDENPHMSHLNLIDKWEEYKLFEKYAPGTLLPTFLMKNEKWYYCEKFTKSRMQLRNAIAAQQGPLSNHFLKPIHNFIQQLITCLRDTYQDGAYLKHVLGCFTADSNTQFFTKSIDIKKLATDFLVSFNRVSKHDSKTIRQELLNQIDNRPLIIYETLFYPRNVIISPHVALDKNENNDIIEVRVDALRFNPLTAWPRHRSEDFCIEAQAAAMQFIWALREKIPDRYHSMSFGADIVFVNGQPKIPDINPGADSGFLKIAFQYQQFIYQLTQHKPPLIKIIHSVAKQPSIVQHHFIKGLKNTILAHPQVNDVEEVAIALRNLHLKAWYDNGANPSTGKECLKKIRGIFTGDLGSKQLNIDSLNHAAERFIKCHPSLTRLIP